MLLIKQISNKNILHSFFGGKRIKISGCVFLVQPYFEIYDAGEQIFLDCYSAFTDNDEYSRTKYYLHHNEVLDKFGKHMNNANIQKNNTQGTKK